MPRSQRHGAPLARAPDVAAFLAGPQGRYVAGRSWVYWHADAAYGFALWGRPDASDMRGLVHALAGELAAGVRPHVSLVDASRLEGVDPAAFEVLQRYVREHTAALRERVTRLALVRPPGLPGAVVAGFYSVLDSPYPTRAFERADDAAAWVALAPATTAAVAAAFAEVAALDPAVAGLKALLRESGASIAIGAAARRLAVSTRTLQRRLAQAGTSYVAEVQAARLERARSRMLESDDPLTAIALEAGFASLQHFSAAFRRATGKAPSAWRAAARTGAA